VKFQGIAASPGIGLGRIFRLEYEEVQVRDTTVPAERVEDEIGRFRAAVEASRRDLMQVRDGIAAELGEDEARIYDAHLLILDDPDLTEAVEQGVRRDLRAVAAVFRGHMGGVAARLEAASDEYLRERHTDVLDVERRVLRHLAGDGQGRRPRLEEPSIIVAHDLMPSEVATLGRERVLGYVTEVGGRTSHSAIVARGRGIPAVMSVRGILQQVKTGDLGAVDGYSGVVEINPDSETTAYFRSRGEMLNQERSALAAIESEPAVTQDGRRIDLGANIELPEDAEGVVRSGADSIGLFRTEFFYLNRQELPDEDEQYDAYRSVVEALAPRPVLFRTMDLGGDKVASYLGMTQETNPFLGWRGIRFALHHPELLLTQLRAIYRAGAHGRVRLMFPMVSSEDEMTRALAICDQAVAGLARDGLPHDPQIEVGVMVETPSAVWLADVLAKHAKFLSIGTNDLTQYTLAMDRDNERLAGLYEPLSPAILRSIRHTVAEAHAAGRWVGVCGEMAGDPRTAVLLVGLEVDELSMACFDVPRVKAAIRSVRYDDARSIAGAALAMSSAEGVRELLGTRVDELLPDFLLVNP
jgi:phosphoenolpyruvate-protein phosphotransferase (PTS system enzyme I)